MLFSDPDKGGGGEGGKQSAVGRDASLSALYFVMLLLLGFIVFCLKISFNTLMSWTTAFITIFPSQLLPKRLDWTGLEHPGTYENLVRELYNRGKSF